MQVKQGELTDEQKKQHEQAIIENRKMIRQIPVKQAAKGLCAQCGLPRDKPKNGQPGHSNKERIRCMYASDYALYKQIEFSDNVKNELEKVKTEFENFKNTVKGIKPEDIKLPKESDINKNEKPKMGKKKGK